MVLAAFLLVLAVSWPWRVGAILAASRRHAWSEAEATLSRFPPVWGALQPDLVPILLALVPAPAQVAWSSGGHVSILGAGQSGRPLHGHGGVVKELKLLPAGRHIVGRGWHGSATVWDTASGLARHTLWHSDEIADLDTFPSGDRVATLGNDGAVVIWSAVSGQRLRLLMVHGFGQPRVMRVHPDGDKVITGVYRNMAAPPCVVIWALQTDAAQAVLRQPAGQVRLFELSPCGGALVTASHTSIFVWSVGSGQVLRTLSMPDPLVWSAWVSISRGGARVVASALGYILVWDGGSAEAPRRLAAAEGFARFALPSRGDGLVVVVADSGSAVWDAVSGSRRVALEAGINIADGFCEHVAVSPDGRIAAACGTRDASVDDMERVVEWVVVWDAVAGHVLHSTTVMHDPGVPAWGCSLVVGPMAAMADALAPWRPS